jgi:hypothetical protein
MAHLNDRNEHGETALFYATSAASARVLLAAGIDVNVQNDWKRTALMDIVEKRDFSDGGTIMPPASEAIMNVLLSRADIDVNAVDRMGRNALMLAATATATERLLRVPGINVMQRDESGDNVLMKYAMLNREWAQLALIDEFMQKHHPSAPVFSATDRSGENVVELLEHAGTNGDTLSRAKLALQRERGRLPRANPIQPTGSWWKFFTGQGAR